MKHARGSLFGSSAGNSDTEAYEAFVNKFKPKKTTDDCYTPPEVYEYVKAWVNDNITPLDGVPILRPFRPGGDYQAEQYPEGCVVLDNPPFSIISNIRRFYTAAGIKYFLFAPSLTLASSIVSEDETFIVAAASITYENGAVVETSFVTNMTPGIRVWVAGDLHKAVECIKKENKPDKRPVVYDYPPNLITCARLGTIAHQGLTLKIATESSQPIKVLDAQRAARKSIFGNGFLISERAAAERAAAERAAAERAAARKKIVWELSEREKAIIKTLK